MKRAEARRKLERLKPQPLIRIRHKLLRLGSREVRSACYFFLFKVCFVSVMSPKKWAEVKRREVKHETSARGFDKDLYGLNFQKFVSGKKP